MSRTFYYRQIQPPPRGEYLDLGTAMAIRKMADADGGDRVVIQKGDNLHWFIKGLREARWEGAEQLDEAIDRLGEVEVYVEF